MRNPIEFLTQSGHSLLTGLYSHTTKRDSTFEPFKSDSLSAEIIHSSNGGSKIRSEEKERPFVRKERTGKMQSNYVAIDQDKFELLIGLLGDEKIVNGVLLVRR